MVKQGHIHREIDKANINAFYINMVIVQFDAVRFDSNKLLLLFSKDTFNLK